MSMSSAPPVAAPAPSSPGRARFSLELLKEQPNEKLQFLFYGETGGGKSQQMLGLTAVLPDCRMLVFSFDGQTQGIKDGMFGSSRNIWVIDGMALYNAQPEEFNTSGAESIEFLQFALEEAVKRFHPHIIAFDGLEKLNRLGEGKMRLIHGLKPTQGFKELAFWKDRSLTIDALLRKAADLALLGVAQTVYYDKQIANEGATDTRDKTPKYIDSIHGRMTFVVEARGTYNPAAKTNAFTAYVQFARANLRDAAVTGTVVDVTWGYDAQTGTWTPKHFPWGPGLRARFDRANRRAKGFTIEYPEVSVYSTDELRNAHEYAPLGGSAPAPAYVLESRDDSSAPAKPFPFGGSVVREVPGSGPAPIPPPSASGTVPVKTPPGQLEL